MFKKLCLVLLLAAPLWAATSPVEIHLTDRRMFTQELDPPSDHEQQTPSGFDLGYDLTVKTGTPVEFFVETGHHEIVADDGSFDSGALVPGETWTHVFNRPGLYRFHNVFHLGGPEKALRGTIHVRP
ncbi:MAG TPA: hypothetical protein VGO93_28365 [Candidatus Xenobia bacterium]|jgi:hypothetical protein